MFGREHDVVGRAVLAHDLDIVDGDLGACVLRPRDHRGEPAGKDRIVGIEHRHPAAARQVEAGIPGAARTAVGGKRHHFHDVLGIGARYFQRTIARLVVDDDHLDGDIALRDGAGDRPVKGRLGIVGGNDETDVRLHACPLALAR